MAHLDADGRAGESKYVAVYLPTLSDPSVAWHNGEWLVTGVGPTGGRIARVTGDGNVVEDIDILEGDEHTDALRRFVAHHRVPAMRSRC